MRQLENVRDCVVGFKYPQPQALVKTTVGRSHLDKSLFWACSAMNMKMKFLQMLGWFWCWCWWGAGDLSIALGRLYQSTRYTNIIVTIIMTMVMTMRMMSIEVGCPINHHYSPLL